MEGFRVYAGVFCRAGEITSRSDTYPGDIPEGFPWGGTRVRTSIFESRV